MKKGYQLLLILLSACVVPTACKKDTSEDAANNAITLLKNNQWKVLAEQSFQRTEGALGGGRGTVAFTTQKPGELRWYTLFLTRSYFNDQNEMIVNTKGEVIINKDFKKPAYGGDIKTFVGDDVWKVNRAESADYVHIFKNDQMVDQSLYPEGRNNIARIQASEDGMLNSSESLTSNYVNHYHYATQKWKNNTFWGNNFVTLRHRDRTYVIAFTRLTNDNGMTILVESDNRVVVQDPQIPSIYTVHYPMTTLQSVPGEYGFVMHASAYDDNVFVIFHSHTSNTRYGVVKVNLTNLSEQLIQAPEQVVPFGLGYSGMMASNSTLIEVDNVGNLYVVELRNENMNPLYSIRKYAASGGNEVILKEQDLHPNTQIQGIKFFNGKLHVAIINRENIPDGDPDNNSFQTKYHMQIICPK